MRLFFDVASNKPRSGQLDLIPLAVAEYAAQAVETISAIQSALADQMSDGKALSAMVSKKNETAAPRGPMPVPENREHVSTDELAAILAVDSQSI